jgi:hypothetical protein
VLLLIVATEELAVDHAPPETVDKNVTVLPTQTDCVPLKVPADGAATIVTVVVALALEHPPEPATVYVIVAVPAPTPVTKPVLELIVATELLLELHVPPEEVELNILLPPAHIVVFPLIVPATGFALTVTVLVAVALGQPFEPCTV